MLDVLSVGAIKLDTFIVLPEASVLCELKSADCKLCVNYGTKIPVEAFVTQIAGTAPNVAVGIAKMKFSSAVVSYMGDDPVYHQAMAFLAAHQVQSTFIKKQKGFHSSAAVVLNFKGESTQLVDHVPHEYRLPSKLPPTQFIHIAELGGGYEGLYQDAIEAHRKHGVRISLNPGVVQIKEAKKVLFALIAVSEVLFLNIHEARLLLKIDDDIEIKTLTAKIKTLGARYVVLTDGKNGAYSFDGEQLDHSPAFPAKFKEATGAGDAFSAGYLGALLNKKPHREALMWGAVNSASVVEHVGPTAGLLSHTEIIKKLKAHKHFKTQEL